jgi:radical SAM protein with 4Fe4S-binding SPASM domain
MNREEFSYILNEVRPFTEHIYLHLMGEPLLNQEIEYFLAESKKKGLNVNLTTNGTLLKNVGDKLINSGALRQINISLHSFEANKKTVELEEYLNNVTDFIKKARANSEMICAIRLWNMDSEDLKGENNLNKQILQVLEENLNIEFSLAEKLQETNRVKLMEKVYLNMAEKFSWPDIKIGNLGENVFCHGLRNQIGILVDGTVVPCCLDNNGDIPLGNILEETMEDILKKSLTIHIKKNFENSIITCELCKTCGFLKNLENKRNES